MAALKEQISVAQMAGDLAGPTGDQRARHTAALSAAATDWTRAVWTEPPMVVVLAAAMAEQMV